MEKRCANVPSVILAEEVSKAVEKLSAKARKGDAEAIYLLGVFDKSVSKLAQSAEAGKHIRKALWPAEYCRKYGITNLWKLNLDAFWRVIYTLRGEQAEIIGFVIDLLDHKKYERKFKYA